jgi:EAL domain-containing protein (putative c-di-GMP-specific phosphodiesterase class I)
MNIKTVAEFVDNQKVCDEVKNLDMDYSQGYFFSKPISSEQLFV